MNLDSLRSLANLLALAARQAWGHRRRTMLVALGADAEPEPRAC